MQTKMATGLNETSVQKKFESLTGAQDSIQSVSLWIIHHKSESSVLVNIWLKVLRKVSTSQRLLLFYLCNDVVQNCKRKQAPVFLESFKSVLVEGLQFVREASIKPKVLRILNIWEERNVYKPSFITQLKSVLDLNLNNTSSSKSTYKPSKVESKPVQSKEAKDTKEKTSKRTVQTTLLAEFKPQTMIHKVTAFRKIELENELKQQQLSKVKFDESTLEAVKQLKDKSQGKEFTNNFEDDVSKIEATVNYLEQDVNDRGEIIDLAETSELYYDDNYREAKRVAIAYKNFGTRINNMKRKLDDIKNKFPGTPSPVASPILDAPSPEPTPPQSDPNDYTNTIDMDVDSGDEKKSRKAKNDPRAEHKKSQTVSNSNSNSSQNNTTSATTTTEQNRKCELEPKVKIPKEEKSHHKSHSRLRSVVSVVTPAEKEKHKNHESHKKSHSQSKRESVEDVEEGCSTPVQDEATIDVPTQKENPIDFLTKLLSKTNSSVPVTGASFLQNLSLLTSTVKSQYEQNKLTKDSPKEEDSNNRDSQSDETPPSWAAWTAEESTPEPTSPVQIPTIQGFSPGVTPVNHILSHSQAMHMVPPNSSVPGGMTPGMTSPMGSRMPVPVQPIMIPNSNPSNVPPGPPPGMVVQPIQTQYQHPAPPGVIPHLMQHGQPQPVMYPHQQATGIIPPGTAMMTQSHPSNHNLASPRGTNTSPEALLTSPAVSRVGFNFNGSQPHLRHHTAPPLPPILPSQGAVIQTDDGGIDDILNQIVTGEGFQQTSPGEKENHPSEMGGTEVMDQIMNVHGDRGPHQPHDPSVSFLSPTKSILRQPKSVLQEVPISTSQPSSTSSVVIPLSDSVNMAGDSSEAIDIHPQFIQILGSVERDPTEDIEDFSEKLNTGNNRGNLFTRNPMRPNLTCLTPQEDISTLGNNHNNEEPRPIMTLGGSRPIQSVVDCLEAGEVPEIEPQLERDQLERSHSYEHVNRIHTVDDRQFEPPLPPIHHHRPPPPHHDPYYNRPPRDPYARYPPERYMYPRDPYFDPRDPYGPPPPKRPYPPEGQRRRPFYRY
ncbi:regulation of nuclear pre-mRNA domain-containing protein 2 isoform X1 [Patella vulgata]|uniref:regulation of nuclear pre-mRNA domain-containing protein 2 isoform X1 n=1 Tax=Patella vulgata TaxID=6465 RepID=UPI002180911C|nr:regulation of nuclear pre-mRNA domain-containing protein 2 isoform X1 [Patella vulgata]